MTQAEMIDNMYERIGATVSKNAIEQAFQKFLADIQSLCIAKKSRHCPQFRNHQSPTGKKNRFQELCCPERISVTTTPMPELADMGVKNHSPNCLSVSTDAVFGNKLSASAIRCDALTNALCLLSSNGISGRCAAEKFSI